MKRLPFVFTVAAVAVVLSGCGSSGCFDNQNSLPLAGFYSMSTKSEVSINHITIAGADAPDGALLLDGTTSASSIYLPFRPAHDSAAFVFHLITELDEDDKPEPLTNDTIFFTYTSEPHFASTDCGAMYYYRITGVSHTDLFIDSVAITDSLITNIDMQRIEIYFHDSEDESEEDEEDTDVQ